MQDGKLKGTVNIITDKTTRKNGTYKEEKTQDRIIPESEIMISKSGEPFAVFLCC